MTDARYGRMSIGRCVRTDYGYVGCWVDVLGYMDSSCSGRRSCELGIPDQGLKNAIAASANRCPREFKTYLNASYDCFEGKPEPSQCLDFMRGGRGCKHTTFLSYTKPQLSGGVGRY